MLPLKTNSADGVRGSITARIAEGAGSSPTRCSNALYDLKDVMNVLERVQSWLDSGSIVKSSVFCARRATMRVDPQEKYLQISNVVTNR